MNEKNTELSWFRLAEAIHKNEREKAFFSYRLLSHSIASEAFKYHIVGDMHQAFNETASACYSYEKAFYLYYSSKEYDLACCMILNIIHDSAKALDHLIMLTSNDDVKCSEELIEYVFNELENTLRRQHAYNHSLLFSDERYKSLHKTRIGINRTLQAIKTECIQKTS